MSKPRILIIENSIAVTGALESIMRSSLHLSDQLDFVFLLPKNSGAIGMVKEKGFRVHELSMKELRKRVFSFLIYLPVLALNAIRLKSILRREKIDFMVCNDFYNLLPVAYKVFFGEVNYICYVRFLPSKFPELLVRFWFGLQNHFAKKIVAVSNAVKKELPISKKIMVIYNELPNEDEKFTPTHSTVILYPSNYIPGKGQEYALMAFAKISSRYTEWRLHFVGGDMGLEKNRRYKDSLKAMSEELGIQNQVSFGNFVNNLGGHYLNAAIVLNFSNSESFSLTCLEAMFYGRAVISTRCGGPEEIIDHKATGWLVSVGDIEDMTNAMDILIKDIKIREKMGADAYVAVREKFSFQMTGERLLSLYLKYVN